MKVVSVKKSVVCKEKFLMIAYFDPKGLGTIVDNVNSWVRLSNYNFDIVNLFGSMGELGLELPRSLDLDHYDGIVIHSTVAYNPANLRSLDRHLKTKISEFFGLKILMKQDEHYRTNETVRYIDTAGIDLVISLADAELVEKIYPAKSFHKEVTFYFSIPGYVSDELRSLPSKTFADRTTDVGYRGSIQPWQLGRLGYEKREVGESFSKVCEKFDLSFDISSKWEDRFFGGDWFRFLGNLRAVLGVESGSSIIDFNGEAERRCSAYIGEHPDASYEQIARDVLSDFSSSPKYISCSPRHFEAAATRTVQILYEGKYSGIFIPDRHYIPLSRDYRNIEEVIDKLRDTKYCERITEAAFGEIIQNPTFHYRKFVSDIDNLIAGLLVRLQNT